MRIAVFVSGNGSNLQNIIDAIQDGRLEDIEIVMVIADRDCYAIERALEHDIPTYLLEDRTTFCDDALHNMKDENVDLIVLAGFLSILTPEFVSFYKQKIINIHPALLPKYGGIGMYGERVHQAVLAAGEKEGGATVHFVTAEVDQGKILVQKAFKIEKDDAIPELQSKVAEVEKEILIEAINRFKANG
ncbi:MAG: phosphoribosylglycinamide formyltransferase [Weeksellaceae bacterium]